MHLVLSISFLRIVKYNLLKLIASKHIRQSTLSIKVQNVHKNFLNFEGFIKLRLPWFFFSRLSECEAICFAKSKICLLSTYEMDANIIVFILIFDVEKRTMNFPFSSWSIPIWAYPLLNLSIWGQDLLFTRNILLMDFLIFLSFSFWNSQGKVSGINL